MTREQRDKVKVFLYGNKDLQQIKVADLDELSAKFMAERTKLGGGKLIHIRCNKVKKNVNTTLKFFHVKDPFFNIYYGFPTSVYKDGNIQWRRLTLMEENSFNLDDPNDVRLFLVMRMHSEVIGSPFGVDDNECRWYVDDPLELALRSIAEIDLFDQAYGAIKELRELGYVKMINFGRILGISEDNLSNEKIAFGLILDEARSRPSFLLEKYNSKDRNSQEVAMAGIVNSIINLDPVTVTYEFRGIKFGPSLQDIIFAMQRDESIMMQVIAELQAIKKWPNSNDQIKAPVKKEKNIGDEL